MKSQPELSNFKIKRYFYSLRECFYCFSESVSTGQFTWLFTGVSTSGQHFLACPLPVPSAELKGFFKDCDFPSYSYCLTFVDDLTTLKKKSSLFTSLTRLYVCGLASLFILVFHRFPFIVLQPHSLMLLLSCPRLPCLPQGVCSGSFLCLCCSSRALALLLPPTSPFKC